MIAGTRWSSAGAHIKSETIFQTAIDACPFGIVLIGPLGKIVLANGATARIFGYAREELIGQAVDILVPAKWPAQPARHLGQFTAHLESRKVRSWQLSGLRKDGSEIPIEVGMSQVRTNAGVLMLGAIVDITDRIRIERLKDEFAAMVSHELRTPLASISGALGLLINAAGKTLPKPMIRLLTIVHNNSQRLVRLVNSILDMEKIESGKISFFLKQVELRSRVERTIEADHKLADTDGVRVRPAAAAAAGEMRALVGRTVADVERELILETLKHCFGNRTHAAGILGIAIRTLRNKLNEYATDGVPIPLPGGGDIGMARQGGSAHPPSSGRRAHILQRGEKRHAVL